MCSRGRRGPWGEACTSLALSRVATGPEAAGRRCRGAANAAAALWDLKTPAPVAASPLHQLLSRRELAGGRFVGVETSEIGERTPPPTPAPNERVQEERLCVCARDSLHFQWPFPARPSGLSPAQRRYPLPGFGERFTPRPPFAATPSSLMVEFFSHGAPFPSTHTAEGSSLLPRRAQGPASF